MYDHVQKMKKVYKSNQLLIPIGGDFFFRFALKQYKNLDKLIYHFNERYTDVKLQYSSPGKFLDAIKKENVIWPVRRDDMFPYADEKHAYWTGYYTSRPVGKGLF